MLLRIRRRRSATLTTLPLADVCNVCDTGIWLLMYKNVHFKWCKGCKKFLHLHAFAQKLGAVAKSKSSAKKGPPKQPTKCDICRGRGRDAYRAKREQALTQAAIQEPSTTPKAQKPEEEEAE